MAQRADGLGREAMAFVKLLEGIFGAPEPPPLLPPTDEEIRLAENEVRIDRALRESEAVSQDLAHLSDTLRVLVEEYRRVRR